MIEFIVGRLLTYASMRHYQKGNKYNHTDKEFAYHIQLAKFYIDIVLGLNYKDTLKKKLLNK